MRYLRGVFLLAALVAVTGAAWAQGPGPGGPGGGPGGGGFGERMRRSPKMQLRGMVEALGKLEKDNKRALTPAQAKKVFAVVSRVKKAATLTDEEAKKAQKEIQSALTPPQLTEIGKIRKQMQEQREKRMKEAREKWMREGGRQGGPGGGPGAMGGRQGGGPGAMGGRQGGGPGGPGGGRSGGGDMAKFNPLNPPKMTPPPGVKAGDEMWKRRAERMKEGQKRLSDAISLIEKKAKKK